MRDTFPVEHGLSASVVDGLVYRSEEAISLTDVQYLALESGVAHGQSMLVVSPNDLQVCQIAAWPEVKASRIRAYSASETTLLANEDSI